MRQAGPDYSQPHVLLPFLREFVESRSPFRVPRVSLVRDGRMQFSLERDGHAVTLSWVEGEGHGPIAAQRGGILVASSPPRKRQSPADRAMIESAAAHLALRLQRLLAGEPPDLLRWRNRNLRQIVWGKRLFSDLCPDLLVKGVSRYFDYTFSELDEYQGFINLAFQSRHARIRLRLTPTGGRPAARSQLISWGPMALELIEDERSRDERGRPEHQVEEYLGYILSRNLPAHFSLAFERNDPPSVFTLPGQGVDFLQTRRPDDSAFFEMLLAIEDRIGVVCACPQECFNLFVLVSAPKESWATNAPWQMHPSTHFAENFSFIRLTDQATILGDDGLQLCLEGLAHAAEPPGLVIFFDSCLHRLIGDDLHGKIRAGWSAAKIPLVYYDIRTTQHPYMQQLRDFWKNVHRQVSRHDVAPDPDRAGFLGLGIEDDRLLAGALARLGIHDGGRIFPRFHLEAVRDIERNQILVGNCWSYVRLMFADMLQGLERPQIWRPLPYGVEGTCAWLDALHVALRGEPAPLGGVPEVVRAREELAAQLATFPGHRIGLVLRLHEAAETVAPPARFGVPLLAALHEFGLGVDLNLFVAPGETAPEPTRVAEALGLDPAASDSVSFFTDARQLPAILARGDFSLVYTEAFRDRRISSCGKAPLALWQLGAGLAGAIASARAIRGTLQSGFHRRYHAVLPLPRAHWRERQRTTKNP